MQRPEASPRLASTRLLGAGRLWLPVLWLVAITLTALILREAPRSASHWALLDALSLTPVAIAATVHVATWAVRSARGGVEQQRAEVASVLHDLRAPLMTARAYLDLLAAESLGPLSTDARHAAGRAAIAAARAQALASALAGTRTTADLAPAATIALREVFADVLAALDAPIREAGAQVEVGELPTVRGDREALYRVFANLVENAVKYRKADATAPRIVVSASRQGAHWRVAVRDWGIGIAAEERGRVFEARARGSCGAERAGQGLGLATVRTLVREQGGEVALDPDVQDGICIEVMLPAE